MRGTSYQARRALNELDGTVARTRAKQAACEEVETDTLGTRFAKNRRRIPGVLASQVQDGQDARHLLPLSGDSHTVEPDGVARRERQIVQSKLNLVEFSP